jgi:hypothetical protein
VEDFQIDFPSGSGKQPVTAYSRIFKCEEGKYYKVFGAVAYDTKGTGSESQSSSCIKCMKEVVKAAPSLTQIGLIALALLLASSLTWMIRRRIAIGLPEHGDGVGE